MASSEEPGPSGASHPDCFLIVFNVAKKHNIGTLVRCVAHQQRMQFNHLILYSSFSLFRCATAFNVKEVCLVGSRQFNTFGSHGSEAYVSYRHYPTLEACCEELKTKHGCEIIGVEITDDAKSVNSHPWTGPVAFMLGNEGQGLSERQMRCCDSFVYIPQYGPGTASLNVAVAASIVLQHYAAWAGYPERSRTGFKYDVAERPQRAVARGVVPLTPEEQAALREARRGGGGEEEEGVAMDFSGDGEVTF
jgi:tRNA C32,U32 (ribose-2'-O)-methylase TrmJ